MDIVLIGASGFVGGGILKETLARGHCVRAIVGRPERLPVHANLSAAKVDIFDQTALAKELTGREAVISAFSGHARPDIRAYYLGGLRSILAAVKQAKVPRLLVVGGAGSLEVAPGVQLVDTPDFPAQWKESALGARDALNLLRQEVNLDWTMLSPSAHLAPGQRTGRFRLSSDQLLMDAKGKSEISIEDYAVAMVNELEKPAHGRTRFTVGY
jgi:putative NADH-flavin reductase